jgi:UDP-glucose 4-epimerase
MKVLLTGGAGFIGSHVIEQLLTEKIASMKEIVVFDTLQHNSLKYSMLKPEIYKANVQNVAYLDYVVRHHAPDVIINLASTTGIENVEAEPVTCMNTIFNGVMNICKAALKYNVRQVIHFSTSEVYGECDDVTCRGPLACGLLC